MKIFYLLVKGMLIFILIITFCAAALNNADLISAGESSSNYIRRGIQRNENPSPFKDALKVWEFADAAGVKVIGAARIGVEMKARDKAASMQRGGDGYSADF